MRRSSSADGFYEEPFADALGKSKKTQKKKNKTTKVNISYILYVFNSKKGPLIYIYICFFAKHFQGQGSLQSAQGPKGDGPVNFVRLGFAQRCTTEQAIKPNACP